MNIVLLPILSIGASLSVLADLKRNRKTIRPIIPQLGCFLEDDLFMSKIILSQSLKAKWYNRWGGGGQISRPANTFRQDTI